MGCNVTTGGVAPHETIPPTTHGGESNEISVVPTNAMNGGDERPCSTPEREKWTNGSKEQPETRPITQTTGANQVQLSLLTSVDTDNVPEKECSQTGVVMSFVSTTATEEGDGCVPAAEEVGAIAVLPFDFGMTPDGNGTPLQGFGEHSSTLLCAGAHSTGVATNINSNANVISAPIIPVPDEEHRFPTFSDLSPGEGSLSGVEKRSNAGTSHPRRRSSSQYPLASSTGSGWTSTTSFPDPPLLLSESLNRCDSLYDGAEATPVCASLHE